ncbi:MAG: PTS fructose transporter subunit IIA [Deltaproteobacteria bacterium RBG_13_52_11]|nr:MAG: PTS fructose transporter subunit IIA [Deltaproteobacteria bacterium RBG_13_52_11]
MIGVVIVTHSALADEFLMATQQIVGSVEGIEPISIDPSDQIEEVEKRIKKGIKKVDMGIGVLILTDMFGGTPSNISLSFQEKGKVEIVTGLNLPMLIKLSTLREEKTLDELASFIKSYGQKNIHLASEIMERNTAGEKQ